MEGRSGDRAIEGLLLPRKSSGLVLRENMKKRDGKDTHICSRIGCSAKISSTKGNPNGCAVNNVRSAKTSFRSSTNGKEIVGSSSRTLSGLGSTKRPCKGASRRQPSSQLDATSSETHQPTPMHGKGKGGNISVNSKSTVSRELVLTEAGSSSRGNSRSCRQRSDLGARDALVGPSVHLSSGNGTQAARGAVSKHGLRSLRCNSISDVVPSNSSSTRKVNVFRKKNPKEEGPSSSSSSSSSDRNPLNSKDNGVDSISARRAAGYNASRRHRNPLSSRDKGVDSISTRRSAGYNGRTGRLGAGVSPSAVPQVPQPAAPSDRSRSPSVDLFLSPSRSYSRPNSSSGWLHSAAPGSPSEVGISRYNMTGIAEVLLALERIEQDEELTVEQMVALEANLFLNGMNSSLYDQHREMRLDIDNMSYEELLALEERIGTVSTALSEEELLRSLKLSIYEVRDGTDGSCLSKEDDVKCSICQEEYVGGDDIGNLQCQHGFHLSCIQQWLRMKNWCPICKSSAESQPQLQTS